MFHLDTFDTSFHLLEFELYKIKVIRENHMIIFLEQSRTEFQKVN